MTAMIDSTQDKFSGMGDAAHERYNMLKSREKDGVITDSERSELERLREHMETQE
jgi:uncharacterized protein YnzC (UPF0291/DUF896 family)